MRSFLRVFRRNGRMGGWEGPSPVFCALHLSPTSSFFRKQRNILPTSLKWKKPAIHAFYSGRFFFPQTSPSSQPSSGPSPYQTIAKVGGSGDCRARIRLGLFFCVATVMDARRHFRYRRRSLIAKSQSGSGRCATSCPSFASNSLREIQGGN